MLAQHPPPPFNRGLAPILLVIQEANQLASNSTSVSSLDDRRWLRIGARIAEISDHGHGARDDLQLTDTQRAEAELADSDPVVPDELRHRIVPHPLRDLDPRSQVDRECRRLGPECNHRGRRLGATLEDETERVHGDGRALRWIKPDCDEDVPAGGWAWREAIRVDRIREELGVGAEAAGVIGQVNRRIEDGRCRCQTGLEPTTPQAGRVDPADIRSVTMRDERPAGQGTDQGLRRVVDVDDVGSVVPDCGRRRREQAETDGDRGELPGVWDGRARLGRVHQPRIVPGRVQSGHEVRGNERNLIDVDDVHGLALFLDDRWACGAGWTLAAPLGDYRQRAATDTAEVKVAGGAINWIAAAVVGYWLGLLIPVVSYVLYPALAVLGARLHTGTRTVLDPAPWPSVTVAIAAHNEEATIARCVASLLDQSYPGPSVQIVVGLDGCSDGTGAALEAIPSPRLRVMDLARMGKASTDNRLVESATSEVVVTTSAGSEFRAGTLERLVAPLRDPRVGCASGVFLPRPDGSVASDSEGIYWRIEYALMAAESELGILAVASGTALAFRRSLFRPIPADSDADVTIAPTVLLNGGLVVHVGDAVVFDDGPGSLSVSLRNRRRMVLRALPATLVLVPRLARTGHLMAALGLVNHKVLRWLSPFALVLWAGSAVILVAEGSPPFRLLTATLAFTALAGTGFVCATSRAGRRTIVGLAVAQVAFTLAVFDALRGRRARIWNRGPG